MSKWYMLHGNTSKELLTYHGQVIVHDSADDLRVLFERDIAMGKFTIKEFPSALLGRPVIRLANHPDMQAVSWPLDRANFE